MILQLTRLLAMKRRANRLKQAVASQQQPFIEHFRELRRRLAFVAATVICGAVAAYAFERQVIAALLKPAGGQQFIYTTVGGGMDFVMRIGLYVGMIVCIPVAVYNVLKFTEPLFSGQSHRFILKVSAASGILAVIGLAFGYFLGLPNALHFLLHQFTTTQIKPLVTIQAYLSFVMMYMVGSALLLQAPLIILFINHIRPFKPQALLRYERVVLFAAFFGAFVMNPTPNLLAQGMVAVPIIVSYQVGIGLVWLVNRQSVQGWSKSIQQLLERDLEVQQERFRMAQTALRPYRPVYATAVVSGMTEETEPVEPTAPFNPVVGFPSDESRTRTSRQSGQAIPVAGAVRSDNNQTMTPLAKSPAQQKAANWNNSQTTRRRFIS